MKNLQKNSSFFNQNANDSKQSNQVNKIRLAKSNGILNLSSRVPPLLEIPNEDQLDIEKNEKFWEFETLKNLDVSFNKITNIPSEICNLIDCTILKAKDNQIRTIPDTLYEGCISLKHIDLSINQINQLSEHINKLAYLKELNISNNQLINIPDNLFQCNTLVTLELHNNHIQNMPQIWNLPYLITLNISNNNIFELPIHCMKDMKCIEMFNCCHNKLITLPYLNSLYSLKYLDCSQNSLENFPILPCDVNNVSRNQLSHIILGYNRIKDIDLNSLQYHKVFSEFLIHNNQLRDIPVNIEVLGSLKILDISNNNLTDLPSGLGYIEALQRIKADGNPIKAIRQNLLTKPTHDLKIHLRSRGNSMFINNQDQTSSGLLVPTISDISTIISHALENNNQINQRIRDISSQTLDLSRILSPPLSQLTSSFIDMVLLVPLGISVSILNLTKNQFFLYPYIIHMIPNLKSLNISENTLGSSTCIQHQSNLSDATVCLSRILLLPLSSKTKQLISLDLTRNDLHMDQLAIILQPFQLVELVVNNNPLKFISKDINQHLFMKTLRISFCQLIHIDNIDYQLLSSLINLDVSNNKLQSIPIDLYQYARNLEYLSIENNNIQEIPPQLVLIKNLKVLLIAGNPQRNIRISIVQKGSAKVIEYLKTRLPVEYINNTHFSNNTTSNNINTNTTDNNNINTSNSNNNTDINSNKLANYYNMKDNLTKSTYDNNTATTVFQQHNITTNNITTTTTKLTNNMKQYPITSTIMNYRNNDIQAYNDNNNNTIYNNNNNNQHIPSNSSVYDSISSTTDTDKHVLNAKKSYTLQRVNSKFDVNKYK